MYASTGFSLRTQLFRLTLLLLFTASVPLSGVAPASYAGGSYEATSPAPLPVAQTPVFVGDGGEISAAHQGSRRPDNAPVPPGPSFFSPVVSPDGRYILWESLERDGSIWVTGADGVEPRFLVKGHSPSWLDDGVFKFVRSVDDGHRILDNRLYRFDLDTAVASLLAEDSDNDDYRVMPVAVESPLFEDRPLSGKVICLDPGHGKNSGAFCKLSGKFEDYYGLQSAMWVKDYLEESGATVKMTRVDNSICPALSARVNFSNSVGAALFTSFHYNAAGNTSAHGLEVYHRSYNATSKKQAVKIHARMKAATGLHSRGVKGDKEVLGFYLGVLSSRHKIGYRTLTEGAFLTNSGDAALVDDPRWNERLSYGIYCGICDTLGVSPVAQHGSLDGTVSDSFSESLSFRWIGARAALAGVDTPSGDGSAVRITVPAGHKAAFRRGGPFWTDYRVRAVLRAASGRPDRYGLVARCSAFQEPAMKAFILSVDCREGKVLLSAGLGDGTGDPVTLASLEYGTVLDHGGWHELVMECRGDRVRAFVDGTELGADAGLSAHEVSSLCRVLLYGKAGIYVEASSDGAASVLVDDFEISPLER